MLTSTEKKVIWEMQITGTGVPKKAGLVAVCQKNGKTLLMFCCKMKSGSNAFYQRAFLLNILSA
jgi:hypothetical protein